MRESKYNFEFLTFDDNNDRVKITSTDTQFYKLPFQGTSGESNNWFRTGNNSSLLPFSYGTQSSQSLNPKSSGHFSLQFGDDEVNKNRNNFSHSIEQSILYNKIVSVVEFIESSIKYIYGVNVIQKKL